MKSDENLPKKNNAMLQTEKVDNLLFKDDKTFSNVSELYNSLKSLNDYLYLRHESRESYKQIMELLKTTLNEGEKSFDPDRLKKNLTNQEQMLFDIIRWIDEVKNNQLYKQQISSGDNYKINDDFANAKKSYLEAIKTDPEHYQAYLSMAHLFVDYDDLGNSLEWYQMGIDA